MVHYFVVLQIICGFFSAFVAGRKGRRRATWWLIGALLPVVGVVLALLAEPVRSEAPGQAGRRQQPAPSRPRRRPTRCCGCYIPDCQGCPHFRRRLFASRQTSGDRGFCEYYNRDLVDAEQRDGAGVAVEDK